MKTKTRVWRRPSLKDIENKASELNKLLQRQSAPEKESKPIRLRTKPMTRRRIVRSAAEQPAPLNPSPNTSTCKPVDTLVGEYQIKRWQKDRAFYMAVLSKDLFDGWTLKHEWGKESGRSKGKEEFFGSEDEALSALLTVGEKRLELGYQKVENS